MEEWRIRLGAARSHKLEGVWKERQAGTREGSVHLRFENLRI